MTPEQLNEINHAAWCRAKMECRVIDALDGLQDVEDRAGIYSLSIDTPKYIKRIMAVCRNILEREKRDGKAA